MNFYFNTQVQFGNCHTQKSIPHCQVCNSFWFRTQLLSTENGIVCYTHRRQSSDRHLPLPTTLCRCYKPSVYLFLIREKLQHCCLNWCLAKSKFVCQAQSFLLFYRVSCLQICQFHSVCNKFITDSYKAIESSSAPASLLAGVDGNLFKT